MTRPRKLFVVMADTAYEGSESVAAFDTRSAADSFAERCRAHDRRAPKPPEEIADTPQNDRLWDSWQKKRDAWLKGHPAKLASTRDGYSVGLIRYFKQ